METQYIEKKHLFLKLRELPIPVMVIDALVLAFNILYTLSFILFIPMEFVLVGFLNDPYFSQTSFLYYVAILSKYTTMIEIYIITVSPQQTKNWLFYIHFFTSLIIGGISATFYILSSIKLVTIFKTEGWPNYWTGVYGIDLYFFLFIYLLTIILNILQLIFLPKSIIPTLVQNIRKNYNNEIEMRPLYVNPQANFPEDQLYLTSPNYVLYR